jgi:serine phosphatase RsbU (regulator of sigma subunit)
LVLFPLMARGELLGAFMVDFETSQAEAAEVDFLHDEKLAVIQGIAQQTAIAIENIRLLKSQKEEAYVSVALLQVAQAVVSLNELGDILEAIVRISPILVGVTRCAIYLWDDERSLFHLSKSYGIAAEDEAVLTAGVYQSGKFPLLDAVRRGDRVVFYPLQEPPESPLDWDRLLPYETSLILETLPEEFSEADLAQEIYHNELLRSEARLLLAIPLSVKGNVLGVMIAEEAEATADEPSHHIRERRLEIITGISQQASLAIQNDLLQREVVERERLEREMQLAREIQKAFLPSRFPKLPGWDLDVRWRPARQVGGDFYDVIDLPGGQVGLVIADVADKGMPAALFMTLVRTLIRAEIHEAGSPATVLERVNNLLIPDTQQGMFITVFYAVLSANTGELVYANAGHNLPLVYRRKEKRVERLLKGGMALGIQENIRIPEHTARLDVGDFVVFYTDGVTEAFSPEGEMYGEERLCETLRTFKGKSAKSLLDAVDESVFAFTGEGFPSDDLTLIGLQRRK